MPTYNRPDSVSKLLNSVALHLSKSFDLFELILVDDGSSDENIVLLNKLIVQFLDRGITIRPLFLNSNSGVSNARNQAISVVNGTYLYFIDDDCEFKIDNIKKIQNYYNSGDKNSVLTGSLIDSHNFFSTLHNRKINFDCYLSGKISITQKMVHILKGKITSNFFLDFAPSGNMVCPASLFNQVKFDTSFIYSEDVAFSKLLIEKGYNILFSPEFKIQHNHNFSNFMDLCNRLQDYNKGRKMTQSIFYIIFHKKIKPYLICLFYRDFKNIKYYNKIFSIV